MRAYASGEEVLVNCYPPFHLESLYARLCVIVLELPRGAYYVSCPSISLECAVAEGLLRPASDPGYRLLRNGDSTKRFDQYYTGVSWRSIAYYDQGLDVADNGLVYRRLIEKENEKV